MTITKDGIDRHQNKCELMEINGNTSKSQYTIGSSDFIRKYEHDNKKYYRYNNIYV